LRFWRRKEEPLKNDFGVEMGGEGFDENREGAVPVKRGSPI
jgi:hypothetical protein